MVSPYPCWQHRTRPIVIGCHPALALFHRVRGNPVPPLHHRRSVQRGSLGHAGTHRHRECRAKPDSGYG
uniref:Putative secreted protein n=1 Tax=Anopheles triannulatus TaxID=58253 RepID=A0A2M4B635_9DIPT